MSKFLIIAILLAGSTITFGQKNRELKLIIGIDPIYESGLIEFSGSSYLLASDTSDETFRPDLYFSFIRKMRFRKESDLIDSISKRFRVYSIVFDSVLSDPYKVLTDRNNFSKSFLIPLDPDITGVKGYLITLFTRRIKSFKYKIVKSDCALNWEDCEVKVLNIAL